jgi:hypothetical protein
MISGGIVVVTPTEAGEMAKEMKVFKLENEPQEEWLHWHPRLSSTDPMCQ